MLTERIRPAELEDAPAIAQVRLLSWRTTYTGLLPEEYLAEMDLGLHMRNWRNIIASGNRQGFPFVALSETGQVVGFALSGFERSGNPRYKGELYALYLLKEAQGQGLGRQLVQASARSLLQAGMENMLVWVLAKNPSRAFYERLGGRLYGQKETFFNAIPCLEVSYVWDDIHTLLEPSSS